MVIEPDEWDELLLDTTPPASKEPPPINPADLIAAPYLENIRPEIGSLTSKPLPPPPRRPLLDGIYSFPAYFQTLPITIFLAGGLTIAAVLVVFCYHMMSVFFELGRIFGLPVGFVTAAALSYASAVFLAVIEGTSEGWDAIEHWPDGDWKEWFWTLPQTAGVAVAAGLLGLGASYGVPAPAWMTIGGALWLLYPVLQLSTLETGSVAQPYSPRVLQTLASLPFAWFVFYAQSAALAIGLGLLAQVTYSDPPYLTALVVGSVGAILLLIYGRLLGRLAWVLRNRD